MGIMFSQLPVAQAMPVDLLGVNPTGNELLPVSILQTFVENLIMNAGNVTPGQVSYQGQWVANQTYVNNNIVVFEGNAFLLISQDSYASTLEPDVDPDHWLGLSSEMVQATDLNDVRGNMTFFSSQNAANAPNTAPYGYGLVFANGTGYAIQVYFANQGNAMYVRQYTTPLWAPWYLMAEIQPSLDVLSTTEGVAYVNPSSKLESLLTITQNTQIQITNFPQIDNVVTRGHFELVNAGAYTITWGTVINWVKGDGTITQNFGDLGITLNSSGSNFFEYWSRDKGNTVFARAMTS